MKKSLAILLALVMLLSLAACGGKNDQPAQNDTPSTNEPASTPDTPAPAEPADDDVSNINPKRRRRKRCLKSTAATRRKTSSRVRPSLRSWVT